jgi:hypothetical protein
MVVGNNIFALTIYDRWLALFLRGGRLTLLRQSNNLLPQPEDENSA